MAVNDVTGDYLVSKATTKEYADGWDRIFRRKKSITTDSQSELGKWLSERIKAPYIEGAGAYVGLKDGDRLLAVVGYDSFRGTSVHAHIAAEGSHWLNRELLWYMFYYPFMQMGVEKIICPIASWNKASIRFCEHLGFSEEAKIIGAVEGGDLLYFTLNKDKCRYLQRKS